MPLDRIGSQLKRDYVAKYLLNPGAVRVSVEARMPVFHMLPDEANTIADYFSTVFLDDSMERYDSNFTPAESRRGQELYGQLGCQACHQLGTQRRLRRPGAVDDRRQVEAGMDCGVAGEPRQATSRERFSPITACRARMRGR